MIGPKQQRTASNLIVRYQLRTSPAIHVYAAASRWCDAVVLKAACASQHDARRVWIDVNQSTADARKSASLTETERC